MSFWPSRQKRLELFILFGTPLQQDASRLQMLPSEAAASAGQRFNLSSATYRMPASSRPASESHKCPNRARAGRVPKCDTTLLNKRPKITIVPAPRVAQFWPKSDQSWSNSGPNRLTEFGPKLVKLCRLRAKFGPLRTKAGRNLPMSGQVWPKSNSAQIWPSPGELGRVWTKFSQICTVSVGVCPIWANTGPPSGCARPPFRHAR